MENKKDHPPVKFGKTGVLIVNLGTPDSTSWFDIRKYLKEFLSDKRVIEVNPIIWQFILNVFILTFRPSKTAKAYKEIWMKDKNISIKHKTLIKAEETTPSKQAVTLNLIKAFQPTQPETPPNSHTANPPAARRGDRSDTVASRSSAGASRASSSTRPRRACERRAYTSAACSFVA